MLFAFSGQLFPLKVWSLSSCRAVPDSSSCLDRKTRKGNTYFSLPFTLKILFFIAKLIFININILHFIWCCLYCSASLRKRTTSSSQESITDLGHRTGSLVPLLSSLTNFQPLSSKYLSPGLVVAGKKDLSADGLMLYPTLESPMKFAVFGFHTGHRSEFFPLHISLVRRLSWRAQR